MAINTSDLTKIQQYGLSTWALKPFRDVKTSKSSIVDMGAGNLIFTNFGLTNRQIFPTKLIHIFLFAPFPDVHQVGDEPVLRAEHSDQVPDVRAQVADVRKEVLDRLIRCPPWTKLSSNQQRH